MAKNVGWVKLFRKLIDNRMYFEEPFDKTHAWIDMILVADSSGTISTSIKQLANRWKWSEGKVRRYLAKLSEDDMVRTDGSHGGTSNGTTITIVKYGEYQCGRRTNGSTDGSTDELTEWGKGDLYNIYNTRRKEEKNTPNTLTSITPKGGATVYEDDFNEFWNLYPKKDGRKNALQSYIKVRKNGTDKDTILSGLNAYIAQCERRGTEKQYIAMASTWLNQERWGYDYSDSEPYAKQMGSSKKKTVVKNEDDYDLSSIFGKG